MKVTFFKSFVRDLKKIKDDTVLERVRKAIERVEAAADYQTVGDLKKLSGTENCYRIRVGEYRLGVILEADTMGFVRCLPRRDLYRFFP